MYGLALPELFPIAAFTFFNYYVTDKFLITYFYRRPPVYDEKLNAAMLETMKFAPLLMFFFLMECSLRAFLIWSFETNLLMGCLRWGRGSPTMVQTPG